MTENNSNNFTSAIIEAITDKKGEKISILDLSGIETASTGKIVICQGRSTSQVSAIADSIRERIWDSFKIKPDNYEGYRNCQWIIIDYGHTMVHVFLPDFRNFYNLEELWNDAQLTVIPDEF